MQNVELLGFLGKDIEERVTAKGAKVWNFSLAVSPKKDETVWYECTIWERREPMFRNIMPYLKKGSMVCIHGDFPTPTIYVDKQSESRIKMRVEPFYIRFVSGNKQNTEKNASNEFDQMGELF